MGPARVVSVLAAMVLALPAIGDVGPPAHLQISEREPGVFAVQWRVPTALPPRAVPMPELPPSCAPEGDLDVTNQPGAWLFAQDWRCDGPLTGQVVGLDFPFADLALTTVARVDLLSGDRFARLITPGDPPWRLPEGTAAPDLVQRARDAVVAGGTHALGSAAHLGLLLAALLLGAARKPLRLLTLFALGQVAGSLAAGWWGLGFEVRAADLMLGLAVALLAREALRLPEEPRRVYVLVAAAGALHGVAVPALLAQELGREASDPATQLMAILGMDAVHLVALAVLIPVGAVLAREASASRRALAYATGGIGGALALGLALTGSAPPVAAAGGDMAIAGPAAQGGTVATPASQRVAPGGADTAMQSFLVIEPFELRHEVMVRLADLSGELGLEADAVLEVAAQDAVAGRLGDLVVASTGLSIDGVLAEPLLQRVDFMSVDATGALPRAEPQPEPVGEALLGVVVAYPTEGMPQAVELVWRRVPGIAALIPATVIDPESVLSSVVTAASNSISWRNELLTDPVPTVTAIPVEPLRVPIPLLSLPLFALAGVVLFRAGRSGRRSEAVGFARVALALGLVLGPMVAPTFAVPGSYGRVPTEAQARRMLAGLLPNVYRALEFREEGRIYDRLAITVTGDMLTEVYLQQRRSLELEERGGAQARVEAVEVVAASEVEPGPDGFSVRAVWTVGGMVTHFGHRHFRQNRYDARMGIAAVDGTWKIRSFEVLEQERVQ